MLDLVPARFARPDPSVVGAILVEPLAGWDGVRVLRRHAGRETSLGQVTLTHAAGFGPDPDKAAGLRALLDAAGAGGTGIVLLRLPPGSALQRDVTLPLGAEAALERVLTYEMDRLTPFAAADVFFAWTVLRRDREAGRLRLLLSLIPKAPLLPMLEACRAAGAGPRAIEIELPPEAQATNGQGSGGQGAGGRLSIPLAHERPAAAMRERRMLALAGSGCAALAVAAVLLPFVLQAVASSRLDRDIAALRPRVDAVQALHRRLAGGSAGADLVEGERRRLGDPLQVIAAVTRVLPDDSFLTDLTLRQGQLTISGQSPAAARLIPAISADPNFTAPAFSAPVTRIEGQNTDLFSIRAGVAR